MENKNSSLKIILLTLGGVLTASIIFFLGFFFGQKSSLSQSEKVINDQAAASRLIPTPVSSPFSSPFSAFSPTTTPSPTPDETKDWKTYTNTQYKYSLKVPSDWGTISPYSGEVFPIPTNDYSSLVLFGNGKGSPFLHDIQIEVQSNLTKEQYLLLRKQNQEPVVNCKEIEHNKVLCGNSLFLIQMGKNLFIVSNVKGISIFDRILSTFKLLD